jgi:arsenical pump membrane protein
MLLFFPVSDIWKTALTSLIGLATLIGIMTRPFRWNEATIAMAGAAVLITRGDLATLKLTGINIGDFWMRAAEANGVKRAVSNRG